MMNRRKKKNQEITGRIHGTYATQAISYPDKRQDKTNIAIPDDYNVEANRNWVNENKK